MVHGENEAVPFDVYHVMPINRILYPRLALPYSAIWGEHINIYLAPEAGDEATNGWSVSIINKISGETYAMDIISIDWVNDNREGMVINKYLVFTVIVPEGVEEGLYNIRVSRSNDYEEPNSLYIFGQSYPSKMVIGHISDDHIGPWWKPKYMKENKFFWRAISVLEAYKVDFIVSTGDFVDGSRNEDFHKLVYQWLSSFTRPFIVSTGNTDYSVMEGDKYFWEKYLAPNSGATKFGDILVLSINMRNGDLPDNTVNWIETMLIKYKDLKGKIYLTHYPVHSTDYISKKVMDKLSEWREKYGLNLVLHGHIHMDDIKKPPEAPVLAIAATSTATSNYYRGFRLITVEIGDNVTYIPENSRNLYEEFIEYVQVNDYTSIGQTVLISGKVQDVTLIVKLRDIGSETTIEGGDKIAEYVYNNRRTVFVKVSASSSLRVVKVYQVQDDTPPEISVAISITPNEVDLRPRVTDEGLGIKDIVVYYSPDNETWKEFTPVIEDEVKFFVMKTPEYEIFYYKVVAEDYAGNKAVYYGSKETGIKVEGEEGEVRLEFPIQYMGIVAILIIIIVGVIIWRMRK
jgi:predicted MPP superfamily phosphohydrolase